MPERPRKNRPADLNRLAASIVGDAIGEPTLPDPDEGKNPAAVALGRLGGKKGGKARAAKLTSERRSEIARNAAVARWARPPEAGAGRSQRQPGNHRETA
jgi:hypothetical protein